jgi:hypothetical protein
VNTKIAQAKFGVAEKASDMLSMFIAKTLIAIIFFFFVLFVSQALAYFIGGIFGKTWLGFLLVGGFYLLAAIVIWIAREKMIRLPIMNSIINRLFNNENAQDEKN